jgi:hypothetical protein
MSPQRPAAECGAPTGRQERRIVWRTARRLTPLHPAHVRDLGACGGGNPSAAWPISSGMLAPRSPAGSTRTRCATKRQTSHSQIWQPGTAYDGPRSPKRPNCEPRNRSNNLARREALEHSTLRFEERSVASGKAQEIGWLGSSAICATGPIGAVPCEVPSVVPPL